MNVHCFYHRADLDGHCSGAIVRRWCEKYGHAFIPHGVNYGDKPDWFAGEGPGGNCLAVICDFTPEGTGEEPYITMAEIDCLYEPRERPDGLIWIDHHKTAIDAVGEKGKDLAGIREVGTAACVLTWEYFFPGTPCPTAVKHLGRYDVFDRTDATVWEEVTLPFQYGLRMRETNPDGTDEPNLWDRILDDNAGLFAELTLAGTTCLAYERKNNRAAARAGAYECTFEGLPCIAMNGRGNSLVLDAAARPEHKLRILWQFQKRFWRVSLYENGHADTDCGEIARKYGGGGHKGAAGFILNADANPADLFLYTRKFGDENPD